MKTLKSIIPELMYLTGVTIAFIAMWSLMGWEYAAFFGGAVLILSSNYLYEVMKVVPADE